MKLLLFSSTFLIFAIISCLGNDLALSARLIGGTQVSDKTKYPWMVRMEHEVETGLFSTSKTYCAATLIASHWALSAAHCYAEPKNNPSSWTAEVGTLHEYDFVHRYLLHPIGWLLSKPEWKSWRLDIEQIFTHPKFVDIPLFDNDIALLKLRDQAPVGSHPYVGVLDLPSPNNFTLPKENSFCSVTGWGCTADGGTVADEEVEMTMPVLPRSSCEEYYPNLSPNQFCAGHPGSGQAACSGDSGGPMTCHNGSKPFLAGIISFAAESTPEQYPSGFLYVAPYVDWIRATMANH